MGSVRPQKLECYQRSPFNFETISFLTFLTRLVNIDPWNGFYIPSLHMSITLFTISWESEMFFPCSNTRLRARPRLSWETLRKSRPMFHYLCKWPFSGKKVNMTYFLYQLKIYTHTHTVQYYLGTKSLFGLRVSMVSSVLKVAKWKNLKPNLCLAKFGSSVV